MASVDSHVTIQAPVDVVYRVSQDYSVRYDWDPFPENIAVVSGRLLLEPLAALYFGRVVSKRLAGLKTFCESSLTSAAGEAS